MDDKRRDWELLRQFVDTNSQAAFADLTRRYLGLVFGTALRELGDRTMAEDVTQAVFLILARRARTFRPSIVLAAWLFDTCKLTAKNARRDERRRMIRERKIAMEIQQNTDARTDTSEINDSTLNEALSALPKADRQAVLLRFVCGYTFGETGEAIGASEEAARKRIDRAIEKLRRILTRGGVGMSAAAIAANLEAQSAALPALEARITDLVFTHSSATLAGIPAYTIAQGVLKSMTLTTLKITAAVSCGLVLAGGAVYRGAARSAHRSSVKTAPKPILATVSGSDPVAANMFKQMIMAYSAIKTCSFTEIADGPGALGMPYNMRFTFEQPEKYEIHIARNGKASRILYQDAKVYAIPEDDPSHFTAQAVSKNYTPITEGLIGAADVKADLASDLLIKNPRDIYSKDFLTGRKNAPFFVLLVGRKSSIDSILVDTLIIRSTQDGQEHNMFIAIGHDDHLIRRITEQNPNGNNFTITYSDIKINQPVAAETFRFTPPSGG